MTSGLRAGPGGAFTSTGASGRFNSASLRCTEESFPLPHAGPWAPWEGLSAPCRIGPRLYEEERAGGAWGDRKPPERGCPEGLRASRILPGQPHSASSLLTFPLRDCREQSWGNPISTQTFQISIYCRIKNGRQPLLSRALPF